MKLSDMEWIAPNGTTISLNSLASGVVFTDPPEGLMMPPPLLTSAPVFNLPGQILEQVTFDTRKVTAHVAIIGESLDEYTAVYSYISSLFNPRLGTGALRVTRDDGSSRLLLCMYSGGLDGVVPIGEDSNTDVWSETDIEFTAFDPYFLDEAVNELIYRTSGSTPWFPLDLASGLDLSSSSLFGDAMATNAGDDLAWPTWVIIGPADNPVLTNLTTGAVMDVSAGAGLTLAAGEFLTIDTLGGTITKVTSEGSIENAWPLLTPASELWPLVGGNNAIDIVIRSAATSATAVRLAYRLRWLTI